MDKIAIFLPTKGRPELFKQFLESYEKNATDASVLIPIIDKSEKDLYPMFDESQVLYTPDRYGLVHKLNAAATINYTQYRYLAFAADDLVIHTPEFDKKIIKAFDDNPQINIIHVNDDLHRGKIANHWIMRSSVVQNVGFFALPTCKHMFIDNFWTKIGELTKTILYLDDVTWEHRHYMAHKTPIDDTYRLSSNDGVMDHDKKAFAEAMSEPSLSEFLRKYEKA